MPNTPVRAAAEGMPTLSRRTALAMTSAGLVSAITVLSRPAKAAPAATVEAPVTRVNKLAKELSSAMDEWMVDLGVDGVPDRWKAHIYPASQHSHPVMFEHLDTASAAVAELEAAFHAEWKTLRAMEPGLNAAEARYYELRGWPPKLGEMTDEEVDRLRRTPVADLVKLPPSRANVEHTEAMRAYEKAERAAARKTGYGKLDKAYGAASKRCEEKAQALLRHPVWTLDELAAKVRVHRVWEYDGQDFEFIMNDIARIAGMGGDA